MNSDVVQSVLHLSSACADEARTPQLRAAGQITGVRPGMTDVLGERQRVQGARAPRWSGASALLRPLADLQLPPPSVGKRRHGVTGVLQADPARVTGSNAITWPVTRLTGKCSVTAKVTAPVILLCCLIGALRPATEDSALPWWQSVLARRSEREAEAHRLRPGLGLYRLVRSGEDGGMSNSTGTCVTNF